MEEEARRILRQACDEPEHRPANLADLALSLFGREHGVDLELPARRPGREPPSFEP